MPPSSATQRIRQLQLWGEILAVVVVVVIVGLLNQAAAVSAVTTAALRVTSAISQRRG